MKKIVFRKCIDSPNLEFSDDPEAEMYWLQFSDFFDWRTFNILIVMTT